MNIDGANWLACTRLIPNTETPTSIHPLANMRINKDLIPDLTHVLAQYGLIEPWLHSKKREPEKERVQSPEERRRLGHYKCILCFCCMSGCPSHWWNGDRFLGPAALLQAWRRLADSRDEAYAERLDTLEEPFWWRERVTAVAPIPLTLWFVASIIAHSASDYAVFVRCLKASLATCMMILLLTDLSYGARPAGGHRGLRPFCGKDSRVNPYALCMFRAARGGCFCGPANRLRPMTRR